MPTMTSAISLVGDIPTLTGVENFFQWETELLNLLMTIGADGIVDGSEPKPIVTPLDSAGEDKKPDSAALAFYGYEQRRLDDWQSRNREARGCILKTVSKSMQLDLRECKTAKEVWDKVQAMHQLKQPQPREQALRELLAFRYRLGDDANKHIDSCTDLYFKAKAAGESIDDARRCDMFINSLPIEFDSVQTRFETSSKENQTFTHLKTLFHNQVQKLERTRNDLGGDVSFAGRKNFNSGYRPEGGGKSRKDGNQQSRSKLNDECFYCHKRGHHKQECRKRQRDLKTGGNKDQGDGKGNTDRTAYLGSGF